MNVSAMGIKVQIIAVPTYPVGVTLTKFADDGDSIELPEMTIMQRGMGVNGDMVIWKTAVPCSFSVNLIPGTEECDDIERLFNLNMVQKNRASYTDVLTAIITHPNGKVTMLTDGYIEAGKPFQDYSSNGRAKSRRFSFVFQNNVN